MDKIFKSGFVSVIGRPNVGKSTLINAIMGEKLNIISDKPQTTRNTIRCIYTREDYQIVFLDTPGIHKPKHKLGEHMLSSALGSLNGVDIVITMIDCSVEIGSGDMYILDIAKESRAKKILVLNKIDKAPKNKQEEALVKLLPYQDIFETIIPISAATRENIDKLMDEIVDLLPEGPSYFPADMIIDMPERFIIAEYIREKIMMQTREEIPYGVAVEVISMKERENKNLIDIDANIYIERNSHKGIIIGKHGNMLKIIGSQARIDIEKLLNCKVNLQLWVKVRKDWRENPRDLKDLGFR